MTMFLAPYTAIADIDGNPLDAGFIYLGEYGKNPETSPIEVYFDADFTIPAAQPIRTRNGYPVRNGSPCKIYLKQVEHSIAIKNKNLSTILVDFFNKGLSAKFIVDASGKTQQQINDDQAAFNEAQNTFREDQQGINNTLTDGFKLAALRTSSNFKTQLEMLVDLNETTCYLNKINDNMFEVFTPFVASGRFLKWRFENTESNFVAEPSDAVQAYVRPFLQTTVQDVFLEVRTDGAFSSYTVVGTPVVAGTRTYINQVGDSLTLTGIRAKRIRLNYYATTNAGKVKITINGSSRLVNLVNKDVNGDAVFDTYSTENASKQIFIADNLPDIDLTLKIEVVGKNDLSTDSRFYSTTDVAYSKYAAYTGSGTPTVSNNETLKIGGSAVDYAILFYPEDKEAAPAWGGSVHGWEKRTAFNLYIDGSKYSLSDILTTEFIAFKNLTLQQSSEIYHHLELASKSADVDIVWKLNKNGASQGYEWVWRKKPFVTNGYTQMWTVWGGATGGAGGAKNGWCDRVLFGTGQEYDLSYGGSGEFGKVLSNEVLFCGTAPTITETSRNPESGNTACLVSIASLTRSFRGFNDPNAAADGVWIQDRATFKKMYAQVYRSAGVKEPGEKHKGLMSVQFYKSKDLGKMLIG